MTPSLPEPSARERLVLALDFAELDAALAMAARLRRFFATVKVGLELFSAEGPLALDALLDEGFDVFLDLKLHDIPTTVGRAARRLGGYGASFLTVHAAGGEAMVRAAVEGFEEGWAAAVARGHPEPEPGAAGILAVTVLTSEPEAGDDLLAKRAQLAAGSGCVGVVCAVGDLPLVRLAAPSLLTAVPGIRLSGSGRDDQARSGEPAAAIRRGADLLVVGRTVTADPAPESAAARIEAEVLGALANSGAAG